MPIRYAAKGWIGMRLGPKETAVGRKTREGVLSERREAVEFARMDDAAGDGTVREPGGPRGRRFPAGGRE
jgi:hypothetical protein